MEPVLDTEFEVVTPENVAFSYRLAGPFPRAAAFVIDVAVRAGALLLAGLVVFLFGLYSFIADGLAGLGFGFQAILGMGLVLAFLVEWAYGVGFEAFMNGQTPGKCCLSLRVVTADGAPITIGQAFLRNVLRFVDLQPVYTGVLGLLSAAASSRFQRLGDLAAGTMVVSESRARQSRLRIDDPRAAELARELPKNFQPSRLLARALSDYVYRRRGLAPGRRREIASHVAGPLRQLLQLPPDLDPDLLLCAVYLRSNRDDAAAATASIYGSSGRSAPPGPPSLDQVLSGIHER